MNFIPDGKTWLGLDLGTWIGILGFAFGIWQWLENKRKGDVMIGFLHGLKTGKLDNL